MNQKNIFVQWEIEILEGFVLQSERDERENLLGKLGIFSSNVHKDIGFTNGS